MLGQQWWTEPYHYRRTGSTTKRHAQRIAQQQYQQHQQLGMLPTFRNIIPFLIFHSGVARKLCALPRHKPHPVELGQWRWRRWLSSSSQCGELIFLARSLAVSSFSPENERAPPLSGVCAQREVAGFWEMERLHMHLHRPTVCVRGPCDVPNGGNAAENPPTKQHTATVCCMSGSCPTICLIDLWRWQPCHTEASWCRWCKSALQRKIRFH